MICPENHFCHDKWRLSECLPRRCIKERPCLNGATCVDYAENGVVKYKCVCRPQFRGSRCKNGSDILRRSADPEIINVKLVIGECNH